MNTCPRLRLALLLTLAGVTVACAYADPPYLHESNPIAMPFFDSRQVTFPVGKQLKTTSVSYSNLEEGTVNWGDPVGGFYEWFYSFEDGRLIGVERVLSVPSESTVQVMNTGNI